MGKGMIETVDIGLKNGKHVFVDLPLNEATLYHLFPSGRRKTLGTCTIDKMIELISNLPDDQSAAHPEGGESDQREGES